VPLALLFLFLAFTDPQELPLPFLLVPFILLFAIFFAIIRSLSDRILQLKHINSTVAAFFLALFPVILLLLSSVGQISFADVAVILLLFFGILFYLRRVDFL
jgi:hypothetical protein